jgi:hypothetical protein
VSRKGAGLALGAAAAVGVAACGGGGTSRVCGNGVVEPPEECDPPGTAGCANGCVRDTNDVQLIWTLLGAELDGGESCVSIGASTAEFTFTGPAPRVETVPCDFAQTFFRDFANGDYQVRGILRDEMGVEMTSGMAVASFTMTGTDQTVTIDFPFADFLDSQTGNLYFRVAWSGSLTCTGAVPPVTQQVLLIERDGMALEGMTDTGAPIDGSGPGMCRPAEAAEMSQKVIGMEWGPAQVTITGLDSTGTPQFEETFDTFVGAGAGNPEYLFDVNSLTPDAGPPDAGPPDAAPPDAGPPDAAPPDAAPIDA